MSTTHYTGEAWPPPASSMLQKTLPVNSHSPPAPCCWLVLLLIALLLCSPHAAFAQPQQPPASQKTKKTQHQPKKTSPAPHADAWTFSSRNPRPVDQIWTKGMAPEAIKKAAVAGLKNKALKNELKAPAVPEVTPPAPSKNRGTNLESPPPIPADDGFQVGKTMRVRSENMSSSWHNSNMKNNMRIDQDIAREETNIYGAYADLESSEDFTLSAGPEFSHTRTQNSSQHAPTDTGSLGLGMQFKWGF